MLRGLSACHKSHNIRCLSTVKEILQRDVTEPAQKSCTAAGWVRSSRDSKNVSFVTINDGSSHESLQVITRATETSIQGKVTHGASVQVEGVLQISQKAAQAVELVASNLTVLGHSPSDYPIQKKYASAEHFREYAHLRPRTRFTSSLLRIQARLLHALSTFFHSREIFQVLPPILSASDCEGAGETFALTKSEDFFGKQTSLIVSSQLHLEALATGLGKVWTIVPTFRAEKSLTARHLAEFRMVEAEICFTRDLHDVMDLVEAMIRHVTTSIVSDPDIAFLRMLQAENIDQALDIQARWDSILGRPWTRITYAVAIKTLQKASQSEQFLILVSESGLAAEHERYLAKHFGGPVFVTNYPSSQKPFYMLPGPHDTVECFDLLVPSMGELCGGSLRDHDLTSLETKMKAAGMDLHAMSWYLDLRRYGSVSHGGFGVGWERLIGYLCGVTNVREVAAFPRWVKHCVA